MGQLLHASRAMSETRNNTRNITKRTLAIPTAAPAIPEKPSSPATSATIKNMTVQANIIFCVLFSFDQLLFCIARTKSQPAQNQ